jgi:hypothetical protein
VTPEAWIAVIAGIILPIVAWSVYHALHDREVQSDLRSRVARIETEIGTHETGLRGRTHEHANMIGRLRAIVYFIGKKLNLDIMNDLDDDK